VCCLRSVASSVPRLRLTMSLIPSVPIQLLFEGILLGSSDRPMIDLLQALVSHLTPLVQSCYAKDEEANRPPPKSVYGPTNKSPLSGESDKSVQLFTSLPYVIDWDRRERGKRDFLSMKQFLLRDEFCSVMKNCIKVSKLLFCKKRFASHCFVKKGLC
jgi:hypothetical protein